MSVYYLSFADGDEEEGHQWLGGCYVKANSLHMAITQSRLHGCNPGGEVGVMGPFPEEFVNPSYFNRLLTSEEEVNAADARLTAH